MNTNADLKEKVALVTGGASGIGRATALRFARAGMKVAIADINEASIQKTLDELKPAPCVGIRVDVRSETDVDAMVKKVEESFGRIDILVHSAGVLRAKDSGPKALVDMTAQEMNDVVDINLKGTFLCNRAVVPVMIPEAMHFVFGESEALSHNRLFFRFMGGTGILIVVHVALDLIQKIEVQLIQRNYDAYTGMVGQRRR